MTKITTQICKDFLIKHYLNTTQAQWKRVRKYKVNDNFYRDFEHSSIGIITIKENNGFLEIVPQEFSNSTKNKKISLASLYQGLIDDSGDKLIGNDVEKTLVEYLGKDEEYEYISSDINDDDGYGNPVTGYYYHSDGRDISFFLYSDNSWVITSD